MRVLQLTNKGNYPPDGGNIAVMNMAKAYADHGYTIDLITIITHKHQNSAQLIPPEYHDKIILKGVKVNTRMNVFSLLYNLLFSSLPYMASRFISKKYKKAIEKKLLHNTYDFIQIEGPYLSPYIPYIKELTKAKIILRSHNIEHRIWERWSHEAGILKRFYLNKQVARLKKFEKWAVDQVNYLLPISEVDKQWFRHQGFDLPMHTATFGININDYPYTKGSKEGNKLCFLGALDWKPNITGLKWFVKNVWVPVSRKHPHLEFHVAGRNAEPGMHDYLDKHGCRFHGEVENAKEFIAQNDMLLVPLFSGSGMRVKIIEAMALGKAVLATPIAVEGINCQNGKDIIICHDKENFIQKITTLQDNKNQLEELGKHARHYISKNFDNFAIAERVLKFINQQE